MLDTNVVSDIVREPDGHVARRIAALEQRSFGISVVVSAELLYGAARSGSSSLKRQLNAVLEAIETVPLDQPADRYYGIIRSELESNGQPIGLNDLLIAAHARSLDATLITNNTREFSRVPKLKIEDFQ